MALKTAGYDGLLISGRSDSPIYLDITDKGVEFKDAASLWGKDTFETQDALAEGKKDGAMAIGPVRPGSAPMMMPSVVAQRAVRRAQGSVTTAIS